MHTPLAPPPRPAKSPRQGRQAGWTALGQLPDGPLDLVGDLHGELDALDSLLAHLGYDPSGEQPQGRRLVFVGDLIDRGPDSPGTVQRVAALVERGRAHMVLGNHDLNAVAGHLRSEYTWLFGHGPVSPAERPVGSERQRQEILGFLARQPLALQRPDLRVVHACWDEQAIQGLQDLPGPTEALESHQARFTAECASEPDPVARALRLQNENPMKLITSGPEVRAPAAFLAGGRPRQEARHPWWEHYTGPMVVFGHYWRIPVPGLHKNASLFADRPLNAALGVGHSMCIDYSVGGRWSERNQGRGRGPFTCRLAALRRPERTLVFDDGQCLPMIGVAPQPMGEG